MCILKRETNKVLKGFCLLWSIYVLTLYSFWYSELIHFSKRRNLFFINSVCFLCISLNWHNVEDSWCNFSCFPASQEPCAPLTAMTLPLFCLDWLLVDSAFVIFAPFGIWEPTCPTGTFMNGMFNSSQMTIRIFRSISSTIAGHFPYPCLNRKELC